MLTILYPPLRAVLPVLALMLALAGGALSHPVPDLPVRSRFHADGHAAIRVEVDPRCFEADPEGIEYYQKDRIEKFSAAEVLQMKDRASERIQRQEERRQENMEVIVAGAAKQLPEGKVSPARALPTRLPTPAPIPAATTPFQLKSCCIPKTTLTA